MVISLITLPGRAKSTVSLLEISSMNKALNYFHCLFYSINYKIYLDIKYY